MLAFDPNDYRKRVLAAVERRGGIEHSDSFELYDIPLDEAETLGDAEVAARVEEVWGFWQRQRDHPKYRVLVGLLVDDHALRSELLLHASSRRAEAMRVRQEREQRDADRYEMLDTAISRLVQRYGGVPAGKVTGLEEIGAMGGLSAAEVAARLRRHKVLADREPAAPPGGVLAEQRRKQIRQLLSEWERLLEGPPTPTLFALLGLDPTRATHTGEIRLRADALRARSRELPPGRVRVVLDELLVHVQDLLEGGGPEVQDYVRSVIEDVAAELRPKVRAAVLVEDQLVGEDYQFLLDEAIELGLDRAEAIRVLTDLTTQLGARIESAPPVPPRRETTSPATPVARQSATRAWEEPLKAARAALRNGRPQEAAREVAAARQLDNGTGATPIRSVADEVERVLAEAAVRWRTVISARAAKRYVEAVEHLEHLRRTASDVPPPTGQETGLDELLAEAQRAIAEADRLVAAAQSGPAAERARGLHAAQALCADHVGAAAALAATPVEAPARVEVTRTRDGSVEITWSPSPTENVDYRVTRLQPDGSWRVVGRTRATELEDGGAPPIGAPPVYAVAAAVSGRYSEITRSDAPAPTAQSHGTTSQPSPTVGRSYSTDAESPSSLAPPHPSAAASAAQSQAAASQPHSTAGRSQSSGAESTASVAPPHSSVAQPSAASSRQQSPISPQSTRPPEPRDDPAPSGIPAVSQLAERNGLLVFTWPVGITEVYVVVRPDAPPFSPDDPQARSWKVTNMRYEIDGGVRIPPEIDRPCHIAVASCRREPNGSLTIASGFAPGARFRWTG
ncbi:Ig-like domain repeat protein [Nocardia sp. NPDC050710]|uniref:Ig-like domain repeat protein n=1 Tax=Nocardia sp. NPDC050710 TaxID=3157220 RepID=UPI0033FC5231